MSFRLQDYVDWQDKLSLSVDTNTIVPCHDILHIKCFLARMNKFVVFIDHTFIIIFNYFQKPHVNFR